MRIGTRHRTTRKKTFNKIKPKMKGGGKEKAKAKTKKAATSLVKYVDETGKMAPDRISIAMMDVVGNLKKLAKSSKSRKYFYTDVSEEERKAILNKLKERASPSGNEYRIQEKLPIV